MQSELREDRGASDADANGFGLPRIVVVGCGGAGSNTISRLSGLEGAWTVAVNTDSQHLAASRADEKILIGEKLTRGMGAGGDPEVGRRAAEMASADLERMLGKADLVFVLAGLGGGTGTGSAPIVARLAKERGAIVAAMVTTPFHLEKARLIVAEEGLEELRAFADTTIVLDNNRLLACAPHLPFQHAFSVVDQIIAEIVQGICETLTAPSLINLDYADICTVMRSGGPSFMFVGEGRMKSSPDKIVKSALKNPLLDVDLRGAKACLLHMTGGPDMTLKEAAAIAGALTQELDGGANVIWGARILPDYAGRVRLLAIVTGVKSAQVLSPAEREPANQKKYIDVIK